MILHDPRKADQEAIEGEDQRNQQAHLPRLCRPDQGAPQVCGKDVARKHHADARQCKREPRRPFGDLSSQDQGGGGQQGFDWTFAVQQEHIRLPVLYRHRQEHRPRFVALKLGTPKPEQAHTRR